VPPVTSSMRALLADGARIENGVFLSELEWPQDPQSSGNFKADGLVSFVSAVVGGSLSSTSQNSRGCPLTASVSTPAVLPCEGRSFGGRSIFRAAVA
jgi:hypothetical protein